MRPLLHPDRAQRRTVVRCEEHPKRGGPRRLAATHDLVLVTSLLDVRAKVIVRRYRCRWLKCVMSCRHLVSQSESGIQIPMYCALIAFLLLQVAAGRDVKPNQWTWKRLCLYQKGWASEADFLAHLDDAGTDRVGMGRAGTECEPAVLKNRVAAVRLGASMPFTLRGGNQRYTRARPRPAKTITSRENYPRKRGADALKSSVTSRIGPTTQPDTDSTRIVDAPGVVVRSVGGSRTHACPAEPGQARHPKTLGTL